MRIALLILALASPLLAQTTSVAAGSGAFAGSGAVGSGVTDNFILGLTDFNQNFAESPNFIEAMQFSYSQFTQKAVLPHPSADGCTATSGGKFYVIGGYGTSGTNYLNWVQIYDPVADTWTQGATKTTAEWGAGCALFTNPVSGHPSIYFFAGVNATGGQSPGTTNAEVYDITSNSWSTLTALPVDLPDGVMATSVGSFIYIQWQQYLYKFDPSASGGAGSYTALTSAPTAAQVQWAASGYVNVSGDDRIYFIGGSHGTSSLTYQNTNYYYSVTNGTWSGAQSVAPYTAHGMLQGVVYNSAIYFLGGYDGTRFYKNLYAYTPATDSWTSTIATMNAFRDGGAGGALYGKTLYVIGGRNSANAPTGSPFGMSSNEAYQIGSAPSVQPFTKIKLNFTGTPSANVRLGVYADAGASGPGSLILDAGTIAASTGWTSINGLLLTLTPGTRYWLAFILSASANVSYTAGQPVNASGPSADSHCYNSQTFGAMPSTFPTAGMTCISTSMYAEQLSVN